MKKRQMEETQLIQENRETYTDDVIPEINRKKDRFEEVRQIRLSLSRLDPSTRVDDLSANAPQDNQD